MQSTNLIVALLVCFSASAIFADSTSLPKCKDTVYDFKTESRIEPGVGNVGYESYKARAQRSQCRKEWTVLMFMNVDDNLKPQALWDAHEIESAYEKSVRVRNASTGVLDVVAELGYTNERKSRRLHMQQSVCPYLWQPRSIPRFNKETEALRKRKPEEFARLYGRCPGVDPVKGAVEVQSKAHFSAQSPERLQSPVVEQVSLSQPLSTATYKERLAAFVKWAVKEYPSQHYALVLWGHGEGLRMVSGSSTLLFTGKEPTFTDAPSVRDALSSVQDVFTADSFGQKRVDVLISDSCLMQMAEVVSEVQGVAKYIVGSQQTQSGVGLPYRLMLYELNTGRYKDPKIKMCGQWKEGKDRVERLDNLPARLAMRIPCQMEASLIDEINGRRVIGTQAGYDPSALKDFTMSAVSSDVVKEDVVPALRTLGAALQNYFIEPMANGKPDYDRSSDVYAALQGLSNYLGGSRDLGAFGAMIEEILGKQMEALRKKNLPATPAMFQLSKAIRNLQEVQRWATLEWIQGPGYIAPYPLESLSGLSVWIPLDRDNYTARFKDMSDSTMYKWTTTQRFSGGYDRIDGRRVPRPPREEKVVGWPDWITYIFGD